jgi:hypothetical protein
MKLHVLVTSIRVRFVGRSNALRQQPDNTMGAHRAHKAAPGFESRCMHGTSTLLLMQMNAPMSYQRVKGLKMLRVAGLTQAILTTFTKEELKIFTISQTGRKCDGTCR